MGEKSLRKIRKRLQISHFRRKFMIDQTDKEILTLLEEKSRMKVKEIAEQVHLSAPTVSQRLIKLEEDGVIKKYTLQTNLSKTGYPIHIFIFTTMISPSHTQYLAYIEGNKRHILNHYRTSGISCYLMEARFETNNQLNLFLENLNKYANYSVLTVINHLN